MKIAIHYTIEQTLRKLFVKEGADLIRQIVREELRKILADRSRA